MTDISASARARIIEQAGNRCGYCRAHQQHVYETLQVEHIEPRAHGGSNDIENLWKRHFDWSIDGTEIVGRTICGRATVEALNLNSDLAVLVRTNWIKVGWHPPED